MSPCCCVQCLSNTKLLTNYLLADEHVREINTTNSSMKGSLVKGKSYLPLPIFICLTVDVLQRSQL